MPYEADLNDDEKRWARGLSSFWRNTARVTRIFGHATGANIPGEIAAAGADAIADHQAKKATTGKERRSTPEEQERINQYYDAHPGSW